MLMGRGTPAVGDNRRWPIILVILFGVAATWLVPFLFYTPYDYGRWLGPWYQHILAEGRVAAFSHPFGNYSPPYLYLLSAATLLDGVVRPLIAIKLLSLVGAVWLAFTIHSLLESADAPRPVGGALWSLLLPTMFFNVPVLAQADAFWVAPCVLAVAASLRGRALRMTVWASIAFAVKAQAIFLAPFVMAVLIERRAPYWFWALPPVIYAAAMLPAWIVGWPAADLATVYYRQVAWIPASGIPFVSNASNWWAVFKLIARDIAVHSFWIGYALAAGAAAFYLVRFGRRPLIGRQLIAAATVSAAMLPWLLPSMHERFFALAEILAFAYAWVGRDRNSIVVAVLMQIAAVLSIEGLLMHRDDLPVIGCFMVAAAVVLLLRELVAAPLTRAPASTPLGWPRTSNIAS